jgi:hypothetical protein
MIGNGKSVAGVLDSMTGGQVGLDYAHHEIHGGSMFRSSASATIGIAGTLIIAFKTGNTAGKWAHMFPVATVSGSALFEILRGPTITVDSGSDLAIYNRNHNSANTSEFLTIETVPEANKTTQDPTITAPGSVILTQSLGAGTNRSAAMSRNDGEDILLLNTIYAYRITSSSASNIVSVNLNWYEHTNR